MQTQNQGLFLLCSNLNKNVKPFSFSIYICFSALLWLVWFIFPPKMDKFNSHLNPSNPIDLHHILILIYSLIRILMM